MRKKDSIRINRINNWNICSKTKTRFDCFMGKKYYNRPLTRCLQNLFIWYVSKERHTGYGGWEPASQTAATASWPAACTWSARWDTGWGKRRTLTGPQLRHSAVVRGPLRSCTLEPHYFVQNTLNANIINNKNVKISLCPSYIMAV